MAEITELLANPQEFFRNKMSDEPHLKSPLLIVLLYAAITGIAGAVNSSIFIDVLPAEAASFGPVIIFIGFLGGFIVSLLMWVLWTGILYLISALLKGAGSFRRTMEFVGYGLLPLVFGAAISAVLLYTALSGISPPSTTDPAVLEQFVTGMMQSPLVLASVAVTWVFLLWTGNIWVFGLKEARSLSTQNAVITVAATLLLYLVYQLATLGVV